MREDEFGEWLENQLEERDITQVEFSEMAGVSRQAIRYIIYGKRLPKFGTLIAILDALDKRLEIVDK